MKDDLEFIDIKKIKNDADKRITIYGQERYGQAVFNAAYALYPNKTEQLKASIYDPFYDDDRVKSFLKQLQKL